MSTASATATATSKPNLADTDSKLVAPLAPLGLGLGRHILVTGGAGYIGSHTVVELLDAGYEVTIVDSLVNSSAASIDRIAEINVRKIRPHFLQFDLCDASKTLQLFATAKEHGKPFDAVIHFAGLKAVGESIDLPLLYFANNLIATLNLLNAMREYECFRLVFSSSANVYGDAEKVPIPETASLSATNAYGRTKLQIEEILRDTARGKDKRWRFVILRYFNPIGAHSTGLIGEDPAGIPNNLAPYISHVLGGRQPFLSIFGDDYPTFDGTGVRDYIHVMDLSRGHLAALHSPGGVFHVPEGSCEAFNLGTGIGVSVKQLLKYFGAAAGKELPFKIMPRRSGDIATCYADTAKAEQVLQWKCTHTIQQAVTDMLKWQSLNPNGFKTTTTQDNDKLAK